MEMTIRHQNVMIAVRLLLGWPPFRPANDCLLFASGQEADLEVGSQLARIATMERKDIVYSAWSSISAADPASFTIVHRGMMTVDVIDNVVPYAADEDGAIIFVSTRADESFVLDTRGTLMRVTGKPKGLGKGRRLAMKRIKARATDLLDHLLENNRFVPHGSDWIEPDAPAETIARFG